MKKKRRIAGLCLVFCMIVGMLFPVQVQAASKNQWAVKSVKRYYADNGKMSLEYQSTYKYDKKGNQKEERWEQEGVGARQEIFKNTYSKGKLKKFDFHEKNGTMDSYSVAYTYNKNGTIKSKKEKGYGYTATYTYKNNKVRKRVVKFTGGDSSIYKYDKYGIPTSYEYKYPENSMYNSKITYKCTYKNGLCTSISSEGNKKDVYYLTGYRAGCLKESTGYNGSKVTYKYKQDKKTKQIASVSIYYNGKLGTKTVYKYTKVPKTAVHIANITNVTK